MKRILIATLLLITSTAYATPPAGYCEVKLCNKLERFTISPMKMFKDSMGEQCFPGVIDKSQAVKGSVVSSSSRWYQGSFNPTKNSVTRIKDVLSCN